MPESISSTGDRTVVVRRNGVLTYISLAFNAFILLLILIAIVSGHKDQRDNSRGDSERSNQFRQDWSSRAGGDGFRHEGGPMQGWGHHEGFGQPGFGGGPGFGGPGFGGAGSGFGGNARFGMGGQRPSFGMMSGNTGWGGHSGFPGVPGGAMGGGNFGTPVGAEAMTDGFMLMLTQKLALTDQESAQIRPIVQGGIQQFQKDMEAQREAHQKMLDDAKTKIRSVLTPDQQKQFDELTAHVGPPASK